MKKPLFTLALLVFFSINIVAETVVHTTNHTNNRSSVEVIDVGVPDIVAPLVGNMAVIPGWTRPIVRDYDTGPVAGEVPYNVEVDKNGRVLVNVPVESFATEFESDAGISLSYDGGSSYLGVMGYGWHIAGLPVLKRVEKDFFTDSTCAPVFDGVPAFSLDGVRLVQQTSGEYLSQIGNVKVNRNAQGDVQAWFEDGRVVVFCTRDSISFYPQSITWPDGRAVSCTYIDHMSKRMPSTISYGDGREMRFTYNQSFCFTTSGGSDHELLNGSYLERYAGTNLYREVSRLERITVSQDNRELTSYLIGYPENKVEAPVCSITRQGANGAKFPALHFNYGNNDDYRPLRSDTLRMGAYLSATLDELVVKQGSFDYGSDFDGLLMYPRRDTYCKTTDANTYASLFTNQDTLVATAFAPSAGNRIPCVKIPLDNTFAGAFALDADGKSGDEIIIVRDLINLGTNSLELCAYKRGERLPDGNFSQEIVKRFEVGGFTSSSSGNGGMKLPKTFLTGDFTGDGKQKIAVVTHKVEENPEFDGSLTLIDIEKEAVIGTFDFPDCHVNFPTNRNISESERLALNNSSDRLLVMDYNGDGKQEICILGDSLKLYAIKDENGHISMESRTGTQTQVGSGFCRGMELLSGDFNGDGIDDLVVFYPDMYSFNSGIGMRAEAIKIQTFLGNGAGVFAARDTCILTFPRHLYDISPEITIRKLSIADVNRDGVAEMLLHYSYDGEGALKTVSFRNGLKSGEGSTRVSGETLLLSGSAIESTPQNCKSVMLVNQEGWISFIATLKARDLDRKMTGFTDSRGTERRFSYARVLRSQELPLEEGQGLVFPYVSCAEGQLVCVAQKTIADGMTVSDKSFRYSAPVSHLQGLGFCGFTTVASSDAVTGETFDNTYEPSKYGVPVKSERIIDDCVTDSTRYAYNIVNSSRRIKILLQSRNDYSLATGICQLSSFGYDAFGNMTSQTTIYSSGSGSIDGIKQSTVEYQNIVSDNLYAVGLPTLTIETVQRDSLCHTSGTSVTYNAKGLPTQTAKWINDPLNVSTATSVTYDSQGRVIKIATKPYSGTAHEDRYSYIGSSRRPNASTDYRGVRMMNTYCGYGQLQTVDITDEGPTTGAGETPPGISLLSSGYVVDHGNVGGIDDTAIAGITTKMHFDEFGRCDSVAYADGATRKITYSWEDNTDGSKYLRTTVTETGEPTKYSCTDAFGRIRRQGELRPDGQWLKIDYRYDAFGRVERMSEPYKGTNAGNWTCYTYDNFGRVVEISHADGRTETNEYRGMTVMHMEGGLTSTTTKDAMGFVTEVSDGGGRIAYRYRPDGKPLSAVLNGNVGTTFEYDNFGRQTDIVDPSAGHRRWTYDDSGHVATETDARGMSVSSTYGSRGELTSRQLSDGSSFTYSYDSHLNLVGVSSDGVPTQRYTYNAMGQIVEVQEGDFRKIVSWCGKKPEKIDYFTGNSHICNVKNVFTEGSFTELRLDSAAVWRIATEDNHGRPSRMEGRGLSLTLGRDRYGRVATRYATGCGNTLQDMEFQYDATTGNMTMQNDYILGTEDLFSYDSMDRLVSDGHYEYGYDALGNVTQKQPFGPLGYNPARPYAVASVQGVSHFPAHSQAVTYNAAQQPTSIAEGGIETIIGYSHDMQRSCMTVTEGDTVTLTRYYDNASYQRMTRTIGQSLPQTKELLYVGGDPYTAPAVMLKDYGENQWTLCYILRDNLGSVVSVADTLGNDLQHLSYDAWGRLRDPLTLSPYRYREEPELLLGRGYTGHEHLQWCGLINMNARLYDPMVARFLSPDPVVQAPDNTQSLNRYSYCLNNPLKYVDPTGMDWYRDDCTGFYKWFNNSKQIHGYTWVGSAGALLGEFEEKVDGILKRVYKNGGLYVEGRVYEIASSNKGAIIPTEFAKKDDFIDEFFYGCGPEITFLMGNHPYTQSLRKDFGVLKAQYLVKAGKTDKIGQITDYASKWTIFDAFTTFSFAKQFVGSYSYDGYTSKDGKSLLNIIHDTKSMYSLMYHISHIFDHNRNGSYKSFSTTYQFYLWKSKNNYTK